MLRLYEDTESINRIKQNFLNSDGLWPMEVPAQPIPTEDTRLLVYICAVALQDSVQFVCVYYSTYTINQEPHCLVCHGCFRVCYCLVSIRTETYSHYIQSQFIGKLPYSRGGFVGCLGTRVQSLSWPIISNNKLFLVPGRYLPQSSTHIHIITTCVHCPL